MFKLGCHLSISGGYTAMLNTALSINARVIQFFTRNPRGGAIKPLDPEDIAEFNRLAAMHHIGPVLAHAPYTMNPCAAKPDLRTYARDTMTEDLLRLAHIPGSMYNFHPGSHVSQGVEVGIELISSLLSNLLEVDSPAVILLETMAGKGSEVGSRFEEIAAIIKASGNPESHKVGVCLDTCHIFDGGYDIVNDLDGVLAEFDEIIGLDRLKAIHLNDSMHGLSSHKDRHACIGQGKLGLDAIVRIINHPALCHLPFYLETPNDVPGYGKEIALLNSYYQAQ